MALPRPALETGGGGPLSNLLLLGWSVREALLREEEASRERFLPSKPSILGQQCFLVQFLSGLYALLPKFVVPFNIEIGRNGCAQVPDRQYQYPFGQCCCLCSLLASQNLTFKIRFLSQGGSSRNQKNPPVEGRILLNFRKEEERERRGREKKKDWVAL